MCNCNADGINQWRSAESGTKQRLHVPSLMKLNRKLIIVDDTFAEGSIRTEATGATKGEGDASKLVNENVYFCDSRSSARDFYKR